MSAEKLKICLLCFFAASDLATELTTTANVLPYLIHGCPGGEKKNK